MDLQSQLSPYVSKLDIAHIRVAPSANDDAAVHALHGAVLFTDFAGFTPLAERLALEGPVGAEKLSEILNWYYGVLTDAIAEQGGDIVLFAGDALVALFTDDADATRRAIHCALGIQRTLATQTAPHGASLRLRATVGAGQLTVQSVGGVGGRWISLLGGAALDAVFHADKVAQPGVVQATASAWHDVAEHAHGELIANGQVAVVHGLEGSVERGMPAKIPANDGFGKTVEHLVLPVVRDRLLSGQAEFLAEFRDVSIVFVRLLSVDPGVATDVDRLHGAAIAAQEEAIRLDGTLYQMLRDDKGCSVVMAFGLPGQAHDDDAARASEAVLSVCNRLRELGIDAGGGIATGPVFCGVYGGASRRNYGIMGPTINRAARLMSAAGSGVIADETTATRAARWMESKELPSIQVKGIAAPLRVFEPLARRSTQVSAHSDANRAMIGRAREAEQLGARVAALREGGTGGGIVIEGDAGMGKSTLLRRVLEDARASGAHILEGAADSIEQSTGYLALRPIVRAVLGVASEATPAQARTAAQERLERLPGRLRELAPLLNVVLPLDFPESELTSQMSGTIRAANLTDLLTALVEAVASDGPLLLALEDLHWTDDASLQLCARILDVLPNVLLVATLRPMNPEPPVIARLVAGANREKLVLETLSPDDIVELIRRRLGATTIPVAVKDLILAKAEGNPFYSEEIALALRESGVIVVQGGECRLAGAEVLSGLNLPGTVKGVITSRVDRLKPAAQLALKVASVLGRSFDLNTLEVVHPSGIQPESLLDSVKDLQAAELLTVEPSGTRFAFRHALIQETTYNLLPFAQRRPLHAAAAEHVEAVYGADLTPYYARLAYHWSRAEQPERAVPYLGEAGRQALESYANQSAVDFFAEAIKLDEGLRGPLNADAQRASWHRQLAEGYYSLIQWDQARAHYEQAIRLSGFPAPRFGIATPLEVVKHVGSRYAKRAVFGDPARLTPEQRESCIEALRACDNLQVVYLWQGNKLSLAHTVFEGANIAARVGPSAESAFARAMVGYLLVMAGMRGIAERDLRSAVAMAEASGQLLQRVSCNMYLGMTLSLLGRPREGIPYLQTADDLVSRLGAGLWKHRGKYMLAEPHLMVGNLDRAVEFFGESATLALSAEPPIAGFANAMRALCWIRQGRVNEGLALIHGPTGIRLVRDNPIGLQLYNTLGALGEGYLWTEQWDEALEAAREGVAIPERGDDANSFFTGYNGHAAIARLFLTLLEQRKDGTLSLKNTPDESDLWSGAQRALKNFRKGAKLFPGAKAPYLLIEGLFQQLKGKHAAARDTWHRCLAAAEASSMPYEAAMAHYELGRHAGDAADMEASLREARNGFQQIGMPRYVERCDAAGRSISSAGHA